MLPKFIDHHAAPFPFLPEGIYDLTINDVSKCFAGNSHRAKLFYGFKIATEHLFQAGCSQVYLDGSFVTSKAFPGDFDALWDTSNVDVKKVHPAFIMVHLGTGLQKQMFGGYFFPAGATEGISGKTFLDFFQTESFSGERKGIIRVKNYLSVIP
ncbi:hypothetical protein IQ277_34670 [Nostocales cyanobacterium LEGE 12452]|nr:hypothetical protein [Nostocales cyanobacterium LEGE 12452]